MDEAPYDEAPYDQVRQLLNEIFDRNEISDEEYQIKLQKIEQAEEEWLRDEHELHARHFNDSLDAELALGEFAKKHLRKRRGLEFDLLGVKIGQVASEYDHLITNLNDPDYEIKRVRKSRWWQSLSPQEQEKIKAAMGATEGRTRENVDALIESEWD